MTGSDRGPERKYKGLDRNWEKSYPWPSSVAVGGALWKRRSPSWYYAVVRVQGTPQGGVPGVRLVPWIWLILGVM